MQLGRYKLLSELGQGGMASVFLGEDPNLNRLVAVKVIQAHLLEDSNLMRRFSDEAKTVATLRSSNIVEIYDYGVQDNQPFIVMEYMDSRTLQFICALQEGKPLPPEVTAAMICQASDGLGAAAKKGVVHRDIKPENLMFNSEGFLKIADFGIAHLANDSTITATGTVLGSPNFMAPEQIEGSKPTSQTDMWAVGAVLYYCLTGLPPFSGPSITATMRNICDKPLQPVPEIVPGTDRFLCQLVEVLLQKKPERRGSGAHWLSAELKTYLTKKGVIDLQDCTRRFIKSLKIQEAKTIIESTTPTPGSRRPPTAPLGSLGRSASGLVRESEKQHSLFNRPLLWTALFLIVAAAGIIGAMKFLVKAPAKTVNMHSTIQSVILAPPQLELYEKEKKTLTAIVFPPGADSGLTWSTSDSKIAQVRKGIVKGIRAGECVITAMSKANQAKVAVSYVIVKPPPSRPPPPKPPPSKPRRPSKPPPPKPRQSAPAIPAIPKNGSLRIISSPPFARIKVDGKNWGETPMQSYRELEAGQHSIELIHRLYPPIDTYIVVNEGSKKLFRYRFE